MSDRKKAKRKNGVGHCRHPTNFYGKARRGRWSEANTLSYRNETRDEKMGTTQFCRQVKAEKKERSQEGKCSPTRKEKVALARCKWGGRRTTMRMETGTKTKSNGVRETQSRGQEEDMDLIDRRRENEAKVKTKRKNNERAGHIVSVFYEYGGM